MQAQGAAPELESDVTEAAAPDAIAAVVADEVQERVLDATAVAVANEVQARVLNATAVAEQGGFLAQAATDASCSLQAS